jgi:type I restriction enzyme, S subunit
MNNIITDHINIWISAQTQKSKGRNRGIDNIHQHGVKRLRELILELAVRGKLVPQDSNDEPARELLKKIAEEKKQLIKEGKIKKQEVLPEVGEDEKPFDLPKGWELTKLVNLAAIIHYGFTASEMRIFHRHSVV